MHRTRRGPAGAWCTDYDEDPLEPRLRLLSCSLIRLILPLFLARPLIEHLNGEFDHGRYSVRASFPSADRHSMHTEFGSEFLLSESKTQPDTPQLIWLHSVFDSTLQVTGVNSGATKMREIITPLDRVLRSNWFGLTVQAIASERHSRMRYHWLQARQLWPSTRQPTATNPLKTRHFFRIHPGTRSAHSHKE